MLAGRILADQAAMPRQQFGRQIADARPRSRGMICQFEHAGASNLETAEDVLAPEIKKIVSHKAA
ncbi:hypothetical protein [Bradyrhizobium hipponense]|uniref:hypothetical protein n=1 Tax=Bradyrhizobium hipponense TaxID=2605638 RepID=UPI001653028F|nr:hypothetical protein [Bradyrhizobium hipponense]